MGEHCWWKSDVVTILSMPAIQHGSLTFDICAPATLRMQRAQGIDDDGSYRAAKKYDTFIAGEHEIHAGPEHQGHRNVFFSHFIPEALLPKVEPFVQVSAANVIHHFVDTADNLLGDRAMLQWAEHEPWLAYHDLDMMEDLRETLPALQKKYYNEKNKPEQYVNPKLLDTLLD